MCCTQKPFSFLNILITFLKEVNSSNLMMKFLRGNFNLLSIKLVTQSFKKLVSFCPSYVTIRAKPTEHTSIKSR